MVDFHSHILYGVDDGSESREMSVKMIEQSIAEGVTHLALTPHHIEDGYNQAMGDRRDYLRKYKDLKKEFENRINLIPSVEIMFHKKIEEELKSGKLMGYGGTKTILVEFHLTDYPQASEGVFYQLKKEGYQVILAHPERNRALQDDVEILYHLYDLGVLFQVNAGSLKGQFGQNAKKFAEKLVEKNLIHAVGSDGHRLDYRNMEIKYAYDRIKALNKPLYHNIMGNAIPLIMGEKVEVLPYKPWIIEEKKGFLWFKTKKRNKDRFKK